MENSHFQSGQNCQYTLISNDDRDKSIRTVTLDFCGIK